MTRVRLVALTIQAQAVLDDGEVLEPVQLPPVTVTLRQWPPDLDELVAQWQVQVDQQLALDASGDTVGQG